MINDCSTACVPCACQLVVCLHPAHATRQHAGGHQAVAQPNHIHRVAASAVLQVLSTAFPALLVSRPHPSPPVLTEPPPVCILKTACVHNRHCCRQGQGRGWQPVVPQPRLPSPAPAEDEVLCLSLRQGGRGTSLRLPGFLSLPVAWSLCCCGCAALLLWLCAIPAHQHCANRNLLF